MSKPAMSQRSMSPPRAPRAAFDGFKGSFAEDVVGRRLRVSVIVPARNEELNLRDVLEAIPQSVSEIIVVDGHSTDDTLGVARRSPRRVLVLSQLSTGKADAVRHGVRNATGEIVVVIDADGSTDPGEIPRFVAALAEGADVAYGSRTIPGGGSVDLTPLRRLGNWGLTRFANRRHNAAFTDINYGYNAFWARSAETLLRGCDGFELEALMRVNGANAGLRYVEVPSFELSRNYGASKLNVVRDGLRILRAIAQEGVVGDVWVDPGSPGDPDPEVVVSDVRAYATSAGSLR